MGVIHKPFYNHDGSHSRTYFGSIETGCYRVDKKSYMDDAWVYDYARPI